MRYRILSVILAALLMMSPAMAESADSSKDRSVEYLLNRLYDGIDSVYVYRDYAAADNRFTMRAKIDDGRPHYVYDMVENWSDNPYSGTSCIRCCVNKVDTNWGGWTFLNGYIPQNATEPQPNYGDIPNAGYNLTGATTLTFRARGEHGAEIVEFFAAGLGWHPDELRLTARYPDSSNQISLGYIHLTDEWEEYSISLSRNDMSYIIRGFGFICTGIFASGEHVFYLDDIRFNGLTERNIAYPRFIKSYETDEIALYNAAFSYDNALAAMALLSDNRQEDAKKILDAFAYAISHDRFSEPRVRNAYAYGSTEPKPGWGDQIALSGYYDADAGQYVEDAYQVGMSTGSTAYVALALLQYDRLYGAPDYVELARSIIDAVLINCADGASGYTAGYDGTPGGENEQIHTYKSIEHNIDLYAVCERLYALTGDAKYQDASASALDLITSLYDEAREGFLPGTETDGTTPVESPLALDAQMFAALSLGEAFAPYERAVDTALSLRTGEGLFPFSDAVSDGGWLEGTAFSALALSERGYQDEARAALTEIEARQLKSGGFPSSTVNEHFTGFYLAGGDKWAYSSAPHIAPTAWYVMAINGFNPYLFPE